MLNIQNDYDSLQDVILCEGRYAPEYGVYKSDDEEFTKYHSLDVPWDLSLLLKQQEQFSKTLQKEGVTCHWIPLQKNLPWQMYTRDVAFVLDTSLYYNQNRRLKERNHEAEPLLDLLKNIEKDRSVKLTCAEIKVGSIEGGDVLPVENGCWVGNGSRSSVSAIEEFAQLSGCVPRIFQLGDHVMHLDTRMTQISPTQVIAYLPAFTQQDQAWLTANHDVIAIDEAEMKRLASNVFVINPQTLVLEARETRLQTVLRKKGLEGAHGFLHRTH